MSDNLYLIELRARGISEDIKAELTEEHPDPEAETYLTTCAFALDSFVRYLEQGEEPAI